MEKIFEFVVASFHKGHETIIVARTHKIANKRNFEKLVNAFFNFDIKFIIFPKK